jgi:hypothetical protein
LAGLQPALDIVGLQVSAQWPKKDREDHKPRNAPGEPRGVWVSGLPFKNFFMDRHQNLAPSFADKQLFFTLLRVRTSGKTSSIDDLREPHRAVMTLAQRTIALV